MKKIFLIAALTAFFVSCQSDNKSKQSAAANGVHTAIVEEVLQTSQYTYLRVKDGDAENWLAIPKMAAEVGDTYYYKGGLTMHEFESKELNRTFPEVIFIDKLSTNPAISDPTTNPATLPGAESNAMQAGSPEANVSAEPLAAIAEEVLQTSKYTYIRAKVNGTDSWLAVTKMDAKVGTTYYFTGGLPMADFESKELKRKFTEVLFLDNISTDAKAVTPAPVAETNVVTQDGNVQSKGSNIELEKKDVNIKHAKGELTVAEMLQNRKNYAGKVVRLKGQVTKFNAGIMGKNWIHLQDGTDFKGKFDLTVTTDQIVKEGDNISVEGLITVDKDFGYGYFYEVLMEDAKIVK